MPISVGLSTIIDRPTGLQLLFGRQPDFRVASTCSTQDRALTPSACIGLMCSYNSHAGPRGLDLCATCTRKKRLPLRAVDRRIGMMKSSRPPPSQDSLGISPDTLLRCVRRVNCGEQWIDDTVTCAFSDGGQPRKRRA
jgi:hypothetical protein